MFKGGSVTHLQNVGESLRALVVMGVADTSSDKDSDPTFILFFTKITFLDAFIIQTCQEALFHKQSHNSDYPT